MPLTMQVRSLSYIFPPSMTNGPEVSVFDDFNLEIHEGEVVSLVGPNGCGKSTLIRICAGIMEPTVGEIKVPDRRPHETYLGYIPQKFSESLFPWLSCLDNIAFPLYMKGMKKKKAREYARQTASLVSPNLPLDRHPYELSIGQQQMIALSRSLVMSPKMLLADEPFSALDFQARLALQDVFHSILEPTKKVAALLISHNVEDAVYLGDRVIVTTPLPMRILNAFDIPVPRPRTHDFKRSQEFFSIVATITDEFLKGIGK